MPQRFYFDENDLNGTVDKLTNNLNDMLDFAYLHEDMVNTIEALMSDWGKENLPTYPEYIEEYENMARRPETNGMTMLTSIYLNLDDGGWSHSKVWTMN